MLFRSFPQVVVKAYEGFKPNLIADYLFDLAKTYNNFYNSKIYPEGRKQGYYAGKNTSFNKGCRHTETGIVIVINTDSG